MRVEVATSGWSHSDWVGPFYPVRWRDEPERWFNHYARHFGAVELASPFDAWPAEWLLRTWIDQALNSGRAFRYHVVAPAATLHAPHAAETRAMLGRFDAEVLDPLAGEGLLGTTVLRLPASLTSDDEDIVAALIEALTERRLALELDHSSWQDHPIWTGPVTRVLTHPEQAAPEHANRVYARVAVRDQTAAWVERARDWATADRPVDLIVDPQDDGAGIVQAFALLQQLADRVDAPALTWTRQTQLTEPRP